VSVDFLREASSVTSGFLVRLLTVLRSRFSCFSVPLSSTLVRWGIFVAVGGFAGPLGAAEDAAAARFKQQVEPILAKYCYDCHGNGISKGSITFDEFASVGEMLAKHDLWSKVLKNVRGGLMPPR